MENRLRIVVITPEPFDSQDMDMAKWPERLRSLRLGLLQSGANLVAFHSADVDLGKQLSQIQRDLVIVDASNLLG